MGSSGHAAPERIDRCNSMQTAVSVASRGRPYRIPLATATVVLGLARLCLSTLPASNSAHLAAATFSPWPDSPKVLAVDASAWNTAMMEGTALFRQGRYAEAETLYLCALREAEDFGSNDVRLYQSLAHLAGVAARRARYAESEQLYRRAAEGFERLGDRKYFGIALYSIAEICRRQQRWSEAKRTASRAIQVLDANGDIALAAVGRTNLALIEQDQGHPEKAEPLLCRSVDDLERVGDAPNLAVTLNVLAVLYLAHGQLQRAGPLLDRALELREQKVGREHPSLVVILNAVAVYHRRSGDPRRAEELLLRAMSIAEHSYSPHHPHLAAVMMNLGVLLGHQTRIAEAIRCLERAVEIYSLNNVESPEYAAALEAYAEVLAIAKRKSEAGAVRTQAREMRGGITARRDATVSVDDLAGQRVRK